MNYDNNLNIQLNKEKNDLDKINKPLKKKALEENYQ